MGDIMRSLLVVTSSSTGNNIFCTPAIRFLRQHLPDTVIDVVALSRLSGEVFEDNPHINRLYVLRDGAKFDRIASQYGAVLALNHNGLRKLGDIRTPVTRVPEYRTDSHIAEQLLQFVARWLGQSVTDTDRRYTLTARAPLPAPLAMRLPSGPEVLQVNIHLGCGTTLLHGWKFFYSRRAADKKLWPLDAYIALGRELVARDPRIRIVLTGTRNEAFLASKFEKAVPGTVNLVGQTRVSDLTHLMARSRLFIAHDCGVLHVAAASDVPIVALFGPTSLTMTGPYPIKPQHRIVQKPAMAAITPDEVADAACALLRAFPCA